MEYLKLECTLNELRIGQGVEKFKGGCYVLPPYSTGGPVPTDNGELKLKGAYTDAGRRAKQNLRDWL